MVGLDEQFAIHRNLGAGRETAPFIVNLQHPHAKLLATRLAAPLLRRVDAPPVPRALLAVSVEGHDFVCSLAEVAAVACGDFGEKVGSMEPKRFEALNALDFLLSGY